eukprot:1161340-Pelagomonas_calceolata.AAC.3
MAEIDTYYEPVGDPLWHYSQQTLILLVWENPYVFKFWPDQDQNAQEGYRRVSVKKEQSNFEVQARCQFWLGSTSYFINVTSAISGACRNVARGQNEFSAIFSTPCYNQTPNRPHSFANVIQQFGNFYSSWGSDGRDGEA